ncbi:ATP-binding protein [bacterium]|nr:ATP-binding protein [bacterium]
MEQIFSYGKPVTGKDLIDRESIVEDIVRDVKGGQSVILAAPRRFGKSSVILESLTRLKKEKIMTGFVDLFEKTSIREFAEGIVETVLENKETKIKKIFKIMKSNFQAFLQMAEFKHVWKEHEFILNFSRKDADENALLEEALNFAEKFASAKKTHLVLAIDEFGELKNWNGKLLKKLRAKFQMQKMVTYIFSGSQESLMRELFTDKAQAFYGFGKIVELDPLPEDDLIKYLINVFQKGGFLLSKENAHRICKLSQCHPHYVKVLAQCIANQHNDNGEKEISGDDIKNGSELALIQVKGELDRDWESLSKAMLQKRVLKFIALGGTNLYSKEAFSGIDKARIYLSVSELQKKGFLRKIKKGEFDFINPFFRSYILMFSKGIFV